MRWIEIVLINGVEMSIILYNKEVIFKMSLELNFGILFLMFFLENFD